MRREEAICYGPIEVDNKRLTEPKQQNRSGKGVGGGRSTTHKITVCVGLFDREKKGRRVWGLRFSGWE